MDRNILLCGVGGQGILLAAKVIATAAELSGLQVTTNEIHGMAQRGGSVTAMVRFGVEIHSPLILEGHADVLGSLEAIEAIRFAHYLKAGGLAVVSAQRIIPVTVSTGAAKYPNDVEERLACVFPRRIYRDFVAEAAALGDVRMANTLMLGAMANGLPEVSAQVWEDALRRCVKPAFLAANLSAFQRGRS
ncbi:MAG: indolepyruvate oxidoreductase subunit beta [Victivallales bacterium]|nr:indolepyruvate oxidoreductase subunit beta [Victivallales bacterium]